jgi:hypothetical protein
MAVFVTREARSLERVFADVTGCIPDKDMWFFQRKHNRGTALTAKLEEAIKRMDVNTCRSKSDDVQLLP